MKPWLQTTLALALLIGLYTTSVSWRIGVGESQMLVLVLLVVLAGGYDLGRMDPQRTVVR